MPVESLRQGPEPPDTEHVIRRLYALVIESAHEILDTSFPNPSGTAGTEIGDRAELTQCCLALLEAESIVIGGQES